MATIVARQLADGSLVQVMPDGTTRPMPDPMDHAESNAMTDEEVEAAALADPDAQPLSDAALERALLGPHPRLVRRRLRLTCEEFAERYRLPLETVLAWEKRDFEADAVARAFMRAIMNDPVGVARAVSGRRTDSPKAAE